MPFRVESSDVLVDEFDALVSDVNAASVSFVDFSDIVMSAGLVLGNFVSDLVNVESVFAQFGRFVEESIRFDAIDNSPNPYLLTSADREYPPIPREQGAKNPQSSQVEANSRLLRALEAVSEVSREDILVEVVVSDESGMGRERSESEHVSRLQDIAVELRQLEVSFEQEKTRITREEVEKRTETSLNERAVENRIETLERELESRLTTEIALPDGIDESVQRLGAGLSVFREFIREIIGVLQSGVSVLDEFRQGLDVPRLAVLTETEIPEGLRASRLFEDASSGISFKETQPKELPANVFQASPEHNAPMQAQQPDKPTQLGINDSDGLSLDVQRVIDLYREERAVELGTDIPEQLSQVGTASDRLSVGAGDLVAAVPFDVVDAVTDIVEIRRDANAELVILEEEAAAEIQLIQESVTLSEENKAKAIERIERETALRRIRIENEVSERQRASFQSVVTNFLSGVGKMIAAEAQLALARRATNALSGVFGGGGAVAAAGSGLFSSVLLPLLGGLSLAYGATKLIAPSSPSADVYERSQYGVSGSGSGQNAVQTSGLTRASEETDTPVLEANINVNVEASGTRLGQANERVKLKTERWGG